MILGVVSDPAGTVLGFVLDPLRARFGVGFGAFRRPFRETFGSLGNYLGLNTQPPSCTRLAALFDMLSMGVFRFFFVFACNPLIDRLHFACEF